MSLLNDMLKDLNKKSSMQVSALTLPMQSRRSFAPFLPIYAAALLILLLLVLFALVYWPKPNKPTIETLPATTAELKSSVPMIEMASNEMVPPPELSLVEEAIEPEEDAFLSIETSEANDAELPIAKSAHVSRTQWRDEHINQALQAIQEGNDEQAIDLFDTVVNTFPTSIEARENLAALYFSHNDSDAAYKTLDEGLQLMPHNLNLLMMKARFLVEKHNYHAALQLLEGFNPAINNKPEFYALLAAIYESTGRMNEAGSLYQALLKLDPSNGQYWLGLGIVLEQKKFNTQAIEAYKRASQSDNVASSGRSYAENRLQTLQG